MPSLCICNVEVGSTKTKKRLVSYVHVPNIFLLLYAIQTLTHQMCSCCQGCGHKHENKPPHSFGSVHATEKLIFTTAIHPPRSGRVKC